MITEIRIVHAVVILCFPSSLISIESHLFIFNLSVDFMLHHITSGKKKRKEKRFPLQYEYSVSDFLALKASACVIGENPASEPSLQE